MTPSRRTCHRVCAPTHAQILSALRESVFAARRAGCAKLGVSDACRTARAYPRLAARIKAVAARRTRTAK
jgi:hypothetical protein